jgi:hypothetical protein
LKQQPASKTKSLPKNNMLEGSRLKSLKELTESEASAAPTPPSPAFAAPATSDHRVASAAPESTAQGVASLQPPTRPGRTAAVGTSSKPPANATQAPSPPSRMPVTSDSSSSSRPASSKAATGPLSAPPSASPHDHVQQALLARTPPAGQEATAAPTAPLRLHATGRYAAEMSGEYQKTGERVNGYPLYKKTEGP